MSPEFWRWSEHGQWHPVVSAHPLARLTFQTAITAPGPPIQTKTPTHGHNGHYCSHTRATLLGPSSFFHPSLPLCSWSNLVINLNSLIRRIHAEEVIACSHINLMSMTTGQVLGVFVVRGLIQMDEYQIPFCFQVHFMMTCQQLSYICINGFLDFEILTKHLLQVVFVRSHVCRNVSNIKVFDIKIWGGGGCDEDTVALVHTICHCQQCSDIFHSFSQLFEDTQNKKVNTVQMLVFHTHGYYSHQIIMC